MFNKKFVLSLFDAIMKLKLMKKDKINNKIRADNFIIFNYNIYE